MNAKAETHSLSMEYDLPHAPTKVWRALTDPKLLATWLMDNDMRPLVGQSFTFEQQPTPWWDGIVRCKVLESDPKKRLRYSWQSGPASSPLDTVVTWMLTPTPSGGTRLTLKHSGFVPTNAAGGRGMGIVPPGLAFEHVSRSRVLECRGLDGARRRQRPIQLVKGVRWPASFARIGSAAVLCTSRAGVVALSDGPSRRCG